MKSTPLDGVLFHPGRRLRAYETPAALRIGLKRYFDFYNSRRRHSALDRRTPDAAYYEQIAVQPP